MIDLHLHTTASDGRSSPESLVAEAAAAGIRTLAVTDHDTVAGVAAVRAAAARAGLALVPGIEVTAVEDGRDVHVLGYFIDDGDAEFLALLVHQRASRRRRVQDIVVRLKDLGVAIDATSVLASAAAESGRAVGRPMIAQALVSAGHARDVGDAFDRYLAEGRPAFVPRVGPAPADVIASITRARGIASLAHPGKLNDEALVERIVAAGLEAIEVHHPDHDADAVARYAALAAAHGLLITGGSDYHGPGSGRAEALGLVSLPAQDFARLQTRAADRRDRS